jgi:hypothetical protein
MKTNFGLHGLHLSPLAASLVSVGCALALAPLQAAAGVVTSCADSGGTDTLRHAVLTANTGDTVDMSALACSTITLASGAIPVGVADLTIKGPGQAALTVDAHGVSRVFTHGASGTLTLQAFTVANGHFAATDARGACIFSNAAVVLNNVTVSDCVAQGTKYAVGGGVFAYDLTTVSSKITNNAAQATTGVADKPAVVGGGFATLGLAKLTTTIVSLNTASSPSGQVHGGGGASVGGMNLLGTTITHNLATAAQTLHNYSYGGGLWTTPNLNVLDTTIDNNTADVGGGIYLTQASSMTNLSIVRNATISGNAANMAAGGFAAASKLTLTNSTIAFNQCNGSEGGGGLVIIVAPVALIGSTIIADNSSSGTLFAPDLSVDSGTVLSGGHDLIKLSDSTQLPADTITLDPQLDVLKNNGGPTRTHALPPGSPAIDAGANGAGLNYDQRGAPFFRFSGAQPDIGAFEFQDTIFASGFEPII